jgi:hypothetical protein
MQLTGLTERNIGSRARKKLPLCRRACLEQLSEAKASNGLARGEAKTAG